jgi:ketosteroid isomerase-like protein
MDANETAANLEFVKGLYAAFKRGDAKPWMDALTESSTWQLYGPSELALCGVRTGPGPIGEFFQTLMTTLEFKNSVQHKFIADGDTVVVLGYVHSMVKATGRDFKSEYVHVLTVKDGKLISYREYLDTAQLLAAYQAA